MAVTELEATFRQSAGLTGVNFKDNRREAVALRRVIAQKVAAISELGSAAFEHSPCKRAFRSEFSRMRSTMALHHASWPIVAIDLNNPDYIRSVSQLREATVNSCNG